MILDKYTIVEESRTFEVYNWLQYFSIDSLKSVLNKAGFNISEFYSDITGKKYNSKSLEYAVVVEKND